MSLIWGGDGDLGGSDVRWWMGLDGAWLCSRAVVARTQILALMWGGGGHNVHCPVF